MSNREPTQTADYKALEEFVVNNDELLQLEERIGRFNIFDALGIVNAEIRHSKFLAWLLDPNESHGQGPLFLKAFLMDLFRQSPLELRAINPVKIDGAELRGVDIRREWRHIDILITCEDPKFVIAIENKVGSKEHSKQLERYRKAVKEKFGDIHNQFVFLTRDGDEPTDEDWTVYTYEDIHRVLLRARNTNATSIGDDVLAFLDHYIRLIGSRFMDDPKIDELCQTIYKNHRAAIEMIVERTKVGRSELLGALEDLIRSDKDRWVFINSTSRSIALIPRQWYEVIPPIGTKPSQDPKSWLWWDIWCYNGSCRWRLCCGKVKDEHLRRRIAQAITGKKAGFGLKDRKKELTPAWNSLGLRHIDKWTEDDPDPVTLLPKVEKLLDKLDQEMARVPSVLKKIVGEWEKKK